MNTNGSAQKQMSGCECFRLLASSRLGRIIYTRQALPAVEPVTFALDGGDIVVKTDRDGKLAAATREAVVAFEADYLDADEHDGWTVTAIGRAREVNDPEEVSRLRTMGLRSWTPGDREHFIRIAPEILDGRRLSVG
jgi:nitroimidazol reductase NimA-like FMN-containing flavoprotein (pyridoxamine 5'-phosphate oxidase superfamily)